MKLQVTRLFRDPAAGAVLLLAVATLWPTSTYSQTAYVVLQGAVQDASGAAIPGATVTITNDATKISDKTTSDSAGRYIFTHLSPASYTATVGAQGFKTLVRSNVLLRVDQKAAIDFTLEVGAVTTMVEVKGTAPLLNSASASLGQVVDNRYITEVPLLGREVMKLAYLAPGVTEVQGDPFGGGSPTGFTGTNFNSNGQRASSAEVRWDGAMSSPPDGTGSGISFFYPWTQPSPEAVEEFKVQTNSFSAEYGNNGGTVINVVSKSGTNQFHGSGYFFFRRPEWDSNGFFSNRDCPPVGSPDRPKNNCKPQFTYDNFGGSVGGPIKKEKTFFFFDYDRIHSNAPFVFKATVPTAQERKGDFSDLRNPDGSMRPIFDPYQVDPNTLDRAPFPGNVIPAQYLDPVALKLMDFYPLPTGSGDRVTGLNNFTKNTTTAAPSNKMDIRIDHNFSANSRLSGRFSRAFTASRPPELFGKGNPADPNAITADLTFYNTVLEHTWTLSPTMIWTNRLAFNRYVKNQGGVQFDPASVGFPPTLAAVGNVKIFPRIWPGGSYAQLGTWFAEWIEHDQMPSANSSLTKVKGAHTLKFGGEYREFYSNYFAPGAPVGLFMFDLNGASATEQNVFGFNPNQGNPIASLLTGFGDPYSWGGLDVQPPSSTLSKEAGVYGQDDWRVTNRLTLNLGLRYEWITPYTERFNRLEFTDFSADTGIDVPGVGRIRGAAIFATPGHRHAPTDKNNLAPRFGFAYRLSEKTVFRGGAGVYYSLSQLQGNWLTGTAFRKSTIWHASLDGGITRNATLEDPFPQGNFLPQGRKYGKLVDWGFGEDQLQFLDHKPEIYQWSVGIQRQLTDTLLFELAYSGNRSTHLPFSDSANYNVISPANRVKYGTAGLGQLVPNPFQPLFAGPNAIFNEPDSIYSNDTIPQSDLVVPYPQFPNGFSTKNGLPVGISRYNSLLIRFEKRYSSGLNFEGHYTYSKFMSDSGSNISWLGNSPGYQDFFNRRAEWSVDGADTPHRFVFGWSYELPVGRGRHLGSGMNRGLNAAIGGWQLNGVLSFQSGHPIALFRTNPIAGGTGRPDIFGNPRSLLSVQQVVDGKGHYFNYNPSDLDCSDPNHGAICAPPDQTPGNAPRFISGLRDQGLRNLDLSIFKNFAFGESKRLEVRAEFFNFTNSPRFKVGSSSIFDPSYNDVVVGSPTFGTINYQLNSPRQVQIGFRFLF